MNKDSKKILFVGILITVIIGFLIIWILIEDHKPPHNTNYENSHATNSELNYQSTEAGNLISI
jgi:cell division protein FtsN